MGTTQECYEIFWKDPGSNTRWNNSCTATYFPSSSKMNKHAGHCLKNKDELLSEVFLWIPTHGHVSVDQQQELTYIRLVQTQDVVWKNCWRWWMIRTDGERESQGNPCCQCNLMMIDSKLEKVCVSSVDGQTNLMQNYKI